MCTYIEQKSFFLNLFVKIYRVRIEILKRKITFDLIYIKIHEMIQIANVIFVLLIILPREEIVIALLEFFSKIRAFSSVFDSRIPTSTRFGNSGGVYLRLLAAGVPTSLAIFAFVRDRGNNLKRRRRTYASFKWSEK